MTVAQRIARRLCAGLIALALTACHGKDQDAHAVASMAPPGPQLTDAYVTDDRDNDVAKTNFAAQNEPIFFVFAATNVNHVPIRAVWFADATDGGAQTALGEEEVTAGGQEYNGAFSHRPPPSGWRPGEYHVDVYFAGQIAHTEHFKISPTIAQLGSNMQQEDTGTAAPSVPPGGVLTPNVTPIPSPTTGGMGSGGAAMGIDSGIPRDAMGNPIISLSDRFQLHTAWFCRDVQFMVELNDARAGVYENPNMTSDITIDFHPGINMLRVSWDAPNPDRNCRLAIAITRNHKYRTLTQIHVTGVTPPSGAYVLAIHVQ